MSGTESAEQAWARRARSFGAAADAYELGRPGYPARLLARCLPSGGTRVLDLAAGTGKLTRGLLALGVEVVAVEPAEAMRALVPAPAVALAGSAEQIPLPDASVDAVFVGQAFHWFDTSLAVPEMARVLRPGGRLALLWNYLDVSLGWVDTLATLVAAEDRIDAAAAGAPPVPPGALFTAPTALAERHWLELDRAGLVAFARSRSAVLTMPAGQREQVLARVAELAADGPVQVPFVCRAWIGERRRG